MWKISSFILIFTLVFPIIIECKKDENGRSSKFTIEDLLTHTYPYTDPRTDDQIFMDPCKAGRQKFRETFFHQLHELK